MRAIARLEGGSLPSVAPVDSGPEGTGGEPLAQRLRTVTSVLVLWLLAAVVTTTLLHPFDVHEYEQYARSALQAPLLHRLPLEYPAPAVTVFLVPLLLPVSYPWAFALLTGVVLVALVLSYDDSNEATRDGRAVGRLMVYLALGSVMFVAGRYDIVAAACALWAFRSGSKERWSAAWTWCSLGAALKLFPAALWPVLFMAEWRTSGRPPWRRLWWVAGATAAVIGLPAATDHGAVLNTLHYYLHRPVEMGSVPAGLSVLVNFHATSWVFSFHSGNIVNATAGPLAAVIEIAAIAGCGLTWWAQARGRLSMQAACLATLTCVVLGSKVLSVQYLVWLMPFWALYRLRVAWVLAAAANLVVYPYVSAGVGHVSSHAFAISLTLCFFARDALVAGGTWAWLRSELGPAVRRPTRRVQQFPAGRLHRLTTKGPPL